MDAGLASAATAEERALPLAREVAALIQAGDTRGATAKLAVLDAADYAQTLHTTKRILAGAVS